MNSLAKQRKRFILAALAIPVLLLVCFVVVPAFDLIRMSFTDWDGLSASSNFIKLDNYIAMFKNPDLWQSLKNNAVYFVVHLCMIPVELAFAVLLTSKLRAAKFYKTMVFLPYIINGVAIAYAFSYFFSPVNGAFDNLLEMLRLGMLKHSWLSDEKIVNFTLTFVSLWRFSGYHIVLFMAALQSVNQDIVEAATIDGASKVHQFTHITLPLLKGVMKTSVTFWSINATTFYLWSKMFSPIDTESSTIVPVIYLYDIVFGGKGITKRDAGAGAAVGVVLTLIIIVVYLITERLFRGSDLEY